VDALCGYISTEMESAGYQGLTAAVQAADSEAVLGGDPPGVISRSKPPISNNT
jgi:hypothetical protein